MDLCRFATLPHCILSNLAKPLPYQDRWFPFASPGLRQRKTTQTQSFTSPIYLRLFQALEALGLPAEFHVQSTGSILSAFLGYQPIRVGEDSFFILFHRFFSMKTYWGWQGQLSHNSRLPSTSLLELHDCRATDHKNSLGVSESGLYHQNCNANPFPPNTKRPPSPPMNKHLR